MEWYIYPIAVFVGFAAGFINTLAGGGSLLTLPVLMFMGLPANVANGTNRIGIILQNIAAITTFKQKKKLDIRQSVIFSLPSIIGAIIGASIAVKLNDALMEKIIGGLLIIMFFVIIYKPDKWVKQNSDIVKSKPSVIQTIIFFLLGLYGGFIQAGIGFFLLAALVLGCGFDLLRANVIKIMIVLIFNVFAFIIFIWHGQVAWTIGAIVAIGNMAGGFVGAKVAVSWEPKFIRYILLITLVVSAMHLFGIF